MTSYITIVAFVLTALIFISNTLLPNTIVSPIGVLQALWRAPELRWIPPPRPPPDPDPPHIRLLLRLYAGLIVISSLTSCPMHLSMPTDKSFAPRDPASINRAPGAPFRDNDDDRSLKTKLDPDAPTDDIFQGVNLSSFMDREFMVETISHDGDRASGEGTDPPDNQDEPSYGFWQAHADDVGSVLDRDDKKVLGLINDMISKATTEAVKAAMAAATPHATGGTHLGQPPSSAPTWSPYSNHSPAPRPDTKIMNGMLIRTSPRSRDEAQLGKMVLSRFARAGKDAQDRRKTKDKACQALSYKFKAMDYGKLLDLDGAGAVALGKMLLDQKMGMATLFEWMVMYDVEYLLREFPDSVDYSDPQKVPFCSRLDIRTQHRRVTPQQVAKFESFIHDWMTVTDMESSAWLKDVLQNSIDPTLLIDLQQQLNEFPEKQRGGLLLFKLLVDHQYGDTFEHRELYQDCIKTYRLSDTKDEDVPISLAGFMALVDMLEPRDRPSNLVRHMLLGQKQGSVVEYTDFVTAQLTQLDSPLFDEWTRGQHGGERRLLTKYCNKLRQQYNILQQKKQWIVSSKTSPLFPAVSTGPSRPVAPQPTRTPQGLVAPNPGWQKWFLSQTCRHQDKLGNICGANHPTKYHDDPDILYRPFDPNLRKKSKKPSVSLKFKPGKSGDFKKRIYNVFEDCLDDDALLANMADMWALEASANESSDEPDMCPSASPPDDPSPSDDSALALAAIGLDSLLNFRAD